MKSVMISYLVIGLVSCGFSVKHKTDDTDHNVNVNIKSEICQEYKDSQKDYGRCREILLKFLESFDCEGEQ